MEKQAEKSERLRAARFAKRAAKTLAECPVFNSRLAARRIQGYFEHHLAPMGLSILQFGLMTQIAALRDPHLGTVAEAMALDVSTLSRNLRGLEEAGLAEVVMVPEDLRKRILRLTPEGEAQLRRVLPVWQDVLLNYRTLMGFSPVVEGLARMSKRLEDQPALRITARRRPPTARTPKIQP